MPDVPIRADGEPARVLVVDDEVSLVAMLSDALGFAGYDVQSATTGYEALAAVADRLPDAIVLDVNLPDVDGFEICRRLQNDQIDVPVLFLTARDDPVDLRTGFGLGGDDYLTKPFSLEELHLRLQAVLRRTMPAGADERVLRCADLVLDDAAHRVWRSDDEVQLSPTEYRLLHYLMLNEDRVLSKSQILDHVWQYDFDGDASIVETYISYLRRKIDKDRPALITTVRGVGYTIRRPES